jgi:sugar phosphate isomerase/epimerase
MMTETTRIPRTLAVSSWSWHDDYYAGRWSLLEQPASAVAAGLHAIECNDFMLPPPRLSRIRRPLLSLLPGAPPELWRYSRTTVRRLKERALASGTSVLGWTINSDFAVPDHHWPAQQIYLNRGLAAARLLQAPLLRVNLGGSPSTAAEQDNLVVQRMAEFVAQSQRQVPGVSITVENHWGISTDIDRHLRIVDAVAERLEPQLRLYFGCCFDPGNMPEGEERQRWWPELAARANHYHLKTTTFDEAGDDGALPHGELFKLLLETGYHGAVTIEFAGDGPALEGIKRSTRLFHEQGAALFSEEPAAASDAAQIAP